MAGSMTEQRDMSKAPITDYGPDPFVVNIDRAAELNTNYRTTLWTGNDLQLILMSIPANSDKGVQMHPNADEYTRVESGEAIIEMGSDKDNLTYQARMNGNYAVVIPAGTWHNFINIGDTPLKMFSVYSNPIVPYGTEQEKGDSTIEEGGL